MKKYYLFLMLSYILTVCYSQNNVLSVEIGSIYHPLLKETPSIQVLYIGYKNLFGSNNVFWGMNLGIANGGYFKTKLHNEQYLYEHSIPMAYSCFIMPVYLGKRFLLASTNKHCIDTQLGLCVRVGQEGYFVPRPNNLWYEGSYVNNNSIGINGDIGYCYCLKHIEIYSRLEFQYFFSKTNGIKTYLQMLGSLGVAYKWGRKKE